MPAARTAAAFLLTTSSVSPKYCRRSEWPTITYDTLSLASIAGLISPVKAPLSSQWHVLGAEGDRDVVGVEDGLDRPQGGERRVDRHVDPARSPRRSRRYASFWTTAMASRWVWFIFQLPEISGRARAASVMRIPSRRAARPGRSPCSMNSSDAPPPVDTWSIRSASPNSASAAGAVAAADHGEARGSRPPPRRPCWSRPRSGGPRTRPSGRSRGRCGPRRSRRRTRPPCPARCRAPSSPSGTSAPTWRTSPAGPARRSRSAGTGVRSVGSRIRWPWRAGARQLVDLVRLEQRVADRDAPGRPGR